MRNAHKMRIAYGRDVIPSRRLFIERFFKIEDKVKGTLIDFRFNRVQRHLEAWRLRCEKAGIPQRAVILKSRHHGCSTYFIAGGQEFVLRDTSGSLAHAAVVAHLDTTAQKLLNDGKQMRDNLPWDLPVKHDNRSVLWYDRPINGQIDVLSAENLRTGRGAHFRFLHMTELAFWKDPEKTFVALSQTVPRDAGTVQTIETTANGAGGWFYEFFWKAWKGLNEYACFFFPWTWDPELRIPLVEGEGDEIYDTLTDEEKLLLEKHPLEPWGAPVDFEQLKWRRWAIANLCGGSLDQFHQEYPSNPREAFIGSGKPVFSSSLVQAAKAACTEPSFVGDITIDSKKAGDFRFTLTENKDGPLKLWSKPQDGVAYCAGSDSAEGVGQDASVVTVSEVQSGCQMATYASNRINATAFGDVCVALCTHFNRAWWLPEINPPGNATLQEGRDAGYDKILRRPVFGKAGKVVDRVFGWRTNEETKRTMIQAMQRELTSDDFTISDAEVAEEMLIYQIVYTDTSPVAKYQAPKGANDDHVIAWGLTIQARRMLFEQRIEEPEEEKVFLSSTQRHWDEWEQSTTDPDPEEDEDPWEEMA